MRPVTLTRRTLCDSALDIAPFDLLLGWTSAATQEAFGFKVIDTAFYEVTCPSRQGITSFSSSLTWGAHGLHRDNPELLRLRTRGRTCSHDRQAKGDRCQNASWRR